jgi:phosphatidylcholine synthase
VLPGIDGRRLDDMVDYLNYVIVPVVFLVAAGYLTPAVAAAPILASAYGFSQQDAKTEDDFFLGFPSYWNIVALYIWLLDVSQLVATAVVLGLSSASSFRSSTSTRARCRGSGRSRWRVSASSG